MGGRGGVASCATTTSPGPSGLAPHADRLRPMVKIQDPERPNVSHYRQVVTVLRYTMGKKHGQMQVTNSASELLNLYHGGNCQRDTLASRSACVIAIGEGWGHLELEKLQASQLDHLLMSVEELGAFLRIARHASELLVCSPSDYDTSHIRH